MLITVKKGRCQLVDFTIPADQMLNIKENNKQDNYLDFARESKISNRKLTVIAIISEGNRNNKKKYIEKRKGKLKILRRIDWFGLITFYGISTIAGYLTPNPIYIYVLNMICKHIFLITLSWRSFFFAQC